MKIRPYLTFAGNCQEAIDLYKRAFKTDTFDVARFSDMPPNPDLEIPEEYQNQVLQAALKIGDDFIRMSDCGPGGVLNDPQSERVSLVIENSVEEVKYAFAVLAEDGSVGIPLQETFFSPCHGVVFDKFGVMWNFMAVAE